MPALLVLMEAHASTAGQNSLYHTGCERHEIVKSRAHPARLSEQGAPVLGLGLLRFATDEAHKVFQIDVAVVVLVEDRLKYAGRTRLLPLHFLASIGNDLW